MAPDYHDLKILAPMVRIGTLPMRLLALDYGADLVYSEELIDHKLATCKRLENNMLGTVDYLEGRKNVLVLRTCEAERGRMVVQIGTADALRALKAAELVCRDAAAIDINMGCPLHFSMSGGMGAALLSHPDKIHDILTTLRRNLPVPVTCKIRLLPTHEATVELARRIEKTGVAAVAVHGRYIRDRTDRDPVKLEGIAAVAAALSIPVIANGDVFTYDDFERTKEATGAASVMAARGAQWNCSIFRPGPLDPVDLVKQKYLRKCVVADNEVKNSKYEIKEMIEGYSNLENPEAKAVTPCKTLRELCSLYGLQEYYDEVALARQAR